MIKSLKGVNSCLFKLIFFKENNFIHEYSQDFKFLSIILDKKI
jgi:hypothetical protein